MLRINLENTRTVSVETEEVDHGEIMDTVNDAAREAENGSAGADPAALVAESGASAPVEAGGDAGGLFGDDGGIGIAAIEEFAAFDFGGVPEPGEGLPGQEGLFQTTGEPGDVTPAVEDKSDDVVDYMTTNRVDGQANTGGLPQETGDEGIDAFTLWLNTQTVRTEVEAELDRQAHEDAIDGLADAEDEDPHGDTPLMQEPPEPAGETEDGENEADTTGTGDDEGGGGNAGGGDRTGGDGNGRPEREEDADENAPEEDDEPGQTDTGGDDGDGGAGQQDEPAEDPDEDASIPADPDGVIGGGPPEGAVDPEEGGETMPADPYGTPMPEIEPSAPGAGTTMPVDPYEVEMVFVFDDPLERVTMPADPYGSDEPMPLPEPEEGARFRADGTAVSEAGFVGLEAGAGFAEDFIV